MSRRHTPRDEHFLLDVGQEQGVVLAGQVCEPPHGAWKTLLMMPTMSFPRLLSRPSITPSSWSSIWGSGGYDRQSRGTKGGAQHTRLEIPPGLQRRGLRNGLLKGLGNGLRVLGCPRRPGSDTTLTCRPRAHRRMAVYSTCASSLEPDAELTEEPLVVLVVLLVVELDVVQRVVGGGQAHLTTSVHLKLPLFCVNLCLLEKAGWKWRR
ncbi:hypothetical protein EYF80_005498 [Liparis tanakae]|uniref:Uncharacterized protein n=1 Tax=Liparis tanakae TaxID=230148 RepID=A0A4Z2J2K0_9TELE|nr:hypothetical protein EYF80_005498 [Liparis tanakae]